MYIPKANKPGEWCFVQDLKAVNAIVLADVNSNWTSSPHDSKFYTVVDLCCDVLCQHDFF